MDNSKWWIRNIDILLVISLLVLLFALPVIFVQGNNNIKWVKITKIWRDYILLLPLFVINHWYLVPKLLLKKKPIAYFVSVFALITFITLSYYAYEQFNDLNKRISNSLNKTQSIFPSKSNIVMAGFFIQPTFAQVQDTTKRTQENKRENPLPRQGEKQENKPPRNDKNRSERPPRPNNEPDRRPPRPEDNRNNRPPRPGDYGTDSTMQNLYKKKNRPPKQKRDSINRAPQNSINRPPRPKTSPNNSNVNASGTINDTTTPLGSRDNKGHPKPGNDQPRSNNVHRQQTGRQQPAVPPYANLLFLSFMIVAVDTGLIYSKHYYKIEQDKLRLKNENAQVQLNMLQHQVNPHFFMNTLNNIYSLIGSENKLPRTAVMHLSKLMRFLLYENKTGKVLLSKEFGFLENYVNLMKLRFDENVEVKFETPVNYQDVEIPSLLFLSFIENAFKYGISYQQKSFIHTHFKIIGQTLVFTCKNSNTKRDIKSSEFGGIGLQNSRQRLDLLFPNNYNLAIDNESEIFTIELKIPLA